MENKFNKEYTDSNEEKKSAYKGVGSFILEVVKIVILAFIIIVPIRVFLFQPFFVQGASMEPSFEDGQYLIINEFGFKETNIGFNSYNIFKVNSFRDIKRQRVMIFRYPLDSRKFFIKRVIGLPGEKLQIKNGQVIIFNEENPEGFILDEREYLPLGLKTAGEAAVTLGSGEYFVMGDNRMFSLDSRAWGPIHGSDIIGEVALRAWPFDKISLY